MRLAVLFVFFVASVARGEGVGPTKTWFAPSQAIEFENKGGSPRGLLLTDFLGRTLDLADPLPPGTRADLRELFPGLAGAGDEEGEGVGGRAGGTFLVWPTDEAGGLAEGPWVVGVRTDTRPGSPGGELVTKVEPLRYAVIETSLGSMTVAFYYDAAPNTTANFLRLAEEGFYDGLAFHRVVRGFVVQAGDPKEDATGGPGYRIEAEFNDRPHMPGVLGMARQGDPLEAQGAMPRAEAANSAGSQFFISLDYAQTRRLDGRYTAFARVVEGFEVAEEIGRADLADDATGRPVERQTILGIRVERAEPGKNPYGRLFVFEEEGE